MAVVFAKTVKGQEEIVSRSGQLSPRVRRVLILIDGKRTVADLRELVAADDLTHTLGALEELGLIEPVATIEETTGQTQPVDQPLPSITAFRPLPDTPNPKELEMARNFMTNTLRTFTSTHAPISLVTSIHEARSHEELRVHFPAWYRTIVDSRSGQRRAEDLRADLLKVL